MNDHRGVPIDEAEIPAWARSRLSPAQRDLNRGLQWVLLIYRWRGRDPSRKAVAQRLHVYTLGRDKKEWDPTFAELAADLDLSERTVEPALKELEADGWIVVTRLHRRNVYQLAWPVRDVLAPPTPDVPLCGWPTSKGRTCTKRSGRGTDTPGAGPCKQHREDPSPDPLPLDLDAPGPQRLRSADPVDNESSTATIAEFDRNGCGVQPQPLRPITATVAVPYVSTFSSFLVREDPGLLSAGQPYVGDAHEAPAAQPDGFAARSLLASIPRYRTAPGWVRKKHLIPMTIKALAAGLGPDAIRRYAELVIAERAFKDHQHIPELRHALERLSRDLLLGDACHEHGHPDCGCEQPDRPWTPDDQADLERALAHLAPAHLAPADLDTGTT